MAKKKRLSPRQYFAAVLQVAKETYRAAPAASLLQLVGAIVTAILPIATTYFAALTTTALADAYAGKSGAGNQAIVYVVVTVLLGVISTAWGSLQRYVSEMMRYKVEAAMSDRMYDHFLHLDFWRYDDKDTIDMFDKATDFARFFPYVFQRVSDLVSSAIVVISSVVALLFVSWWIGGIVLIAIIPGVYLQFKLSRAQVEHRNANVVTRRSKGMLEWILGDKQQTAELRLYGLAKHLLKLRRQLRDKDEKARIEFERSYIIKQLGADLLQAAAEVISLVYITMQIIGRHHPVGFFIYVQQIVSRALNGTNSFVSQLSTLDEDLANLFDYQSFMALPSGGDGKRQLKHAPDTIDISGVSFRYPGATTNVLESVSFSIRRGQHIALVGENGAGKSTLVKLISGLYAPTKGTIKVDGIDLAMYQLSSWHRLLGVLQQSSNSYDFTTVRQSILFGDISRGYDDTRYKNAVTLSESEKFIAKLPKKDDNYISPWIADEDDTKGTQLSGGQYQRLALARDFYRDSPIIILDEPTSAIDALAESRIFKRLFADKTKTVITISHRLTTVEKADVIYMLQDGNIVERGTHTELVDKKGAYYRMFASQLK